MLISVIIPVYNVDKYLEKCVESVLNQSYKNIEIILIDDGSEDNSGKICDYYSKKYTNITTIHKKNEGLGFARNTGLSVCNGEYVFFVDSDDYLDYDMIETLVHNSVDNGLDYCKATFRRIDNVGNIRFQKKYNNELFKGEAIKKDLLPRLIGSSNKKHDSIEMSATGCFYKLEIIKKHKINFPSERKMISEDLIFNIDYLGYSKKAMVIDYCGYNYRINNESLTKKYKKDRFKLCVFFYVELRKKIVNLGYDDEVLLRLSKMFFVHLKMCILQEKKSISHNIFKDTKTNLKEICSSNIVNKVIDEYPVEDLNYKQKIFLYLIKYKLVFIIYIIINLM